MERFIVYEIDIVILHNFTSIQYFSKTNIHVVKCEKLFRPQF